MSEFEQVQTPREFAELLARSPIELGEASIGLHFRNSLEVQDALTAIETYVEPQSQQKIGLIGSRTKEKYFAYSAKRLFTKLHFQLGLTEEFDLSEVEQIKLHLYDTITIPDRIINQLQPLTDKLNSLQQETLSLSDIDFASLPHEMTRFLSIPFLNLPHLLRPQSSQEVMVDPLLKVTPNPAAFYPDIDLAVLRNPSFKDDPSTSRIESVQLLGEHSGILVHINFLFPPTLYSDGLELVSESMLDSYIPITIPT